MTEKPANVVLISMDTLRADVAYKGNFKLIELLLKKGVVFENAVSSVPLTPPSHATVFTGLNPPRHGIRHLLKEKLNPEVTTLAELLQAQGYQTGGVVSCPGMNSWYDLNRGFDIYDDEIPPLADGRDAVELADVKLRGTALKRAPRVTQIANEWLDRLDPSKPFFLFAHYFDAHWPYNAPDKPLRKLANAYEEEVAYADHYANLLVEHIETLTDGFDNTLLIVFSDHGEDLAGWYDNDHAGKMGCPQEEGHGCLLFEATQHVPLAMMGLNLPVGVSISDQVRLCDVMPTIAELIGMKIADDLDGHSLVRLIEGTEKGHRPAYFETFFPEELATQNNKFSHLKPLRGVKIENKFKVIWQEGNDRVEIYDLENDPEERSPTILCP